MHDDLKRYLNQQLDLFGDELILSEEVEKVLVDPEKKLAELKRVIESCRKCDLWKTRTNTVFGSGDFNARLAFIGEAPGRDEDLQGKPFVGRAGMLLERLLKTIGIKRDEVFIGNVLKCRPPNNRTPSSFEVSQCEPYLVAQLQLIRPRLIVCLGLTAAKTLLKVEYTLGQFRQNMFKYHGIDVLVTYHPAAVLRNPNLEKFIREDFEKIKRLYSES